MLIYLDCIISTIEWDEEFPEILLSNFWYLSSFKSHYELILSEILSNIFFGWFWLEIINVSQWVFLWTKPIVWWYGLIKLLSSLLFQLGRLLFDSKYMLIIIFCEVITIKYEAISTIDDNILSTNLLLEINDTKSAGE